MYVCIFVWLYVGMRSTETCVYLIDFPRDANRRANSKMAGCSSFRSSFLYVNKQRTSDLSEIDICNDFATNSKTCLRILAHLFEVWTILHFLHVFTNKKSRHDSEKSNVLTIIE